jgi:hypothetical protein
MPSKRNQSRKNSRKPRITPQMLAQALKNLKKPSQGRSRKRPKAARQNFGGSGDLTNSRAIAQLLNDPCKAPTVPIYGSLRGYLARMSNIQSLALAGAAGAKSGYCVWFPSYSNPANRNTSAANPINFFIFNNSTTASFPTTADFGHAAAGSTTTAVSLSDPAGAFLLSTTCQDLRSMAACLELEYTGTTVNGSGVVYPLKNIPLTSFILANGGNPTIDQMMQYADTSVRGTSMTDIKWRPTDESMWFKDSYVGAYTPSATPGNNTGISVSEQRNPPMGIGFAYTNISSTSDYNVKATKVFEWRPEMVSGLSAQAPRGVENTSWLDKGLAYLDAKNPNWEISIDPSTQQQLMNGFSQMVLSGSMAGFKALTGI